VSDGVSVIGCRSPQQLGSLSSISWSAYQYDRHKPKFSKSRDLFF